MSAVSWNEHTLVLRVYIQPRASRDQIIGLHGDELKIAITAPPVDGAANKHLLKFLAKQFKVSRSAIQLQKGETGRHKQIAIESPQQLPEQVASLT